MRPSLNFQKKSPLKLRNFVFHPRVAPAHYLYRGLQLQHWAHVLRRLRGQGHSLQQRWIQVRTDGEGSHGHDGCLQHPGNTEGSDRSPECRRLHRYDVINGYHFRTARNEFPFTVFSQPILTEFTKERRNWSSGRVVVRSGREKRRWKKEDDNNN